MKRYCFDTSGISNPLEFVPADIYDSLWKKFNRLIETSEIAVTTEIYDEMTHIQGMVGDCIRLNKKSMVLEINDPSWDWQSYVDQAVAMQLTHRQYSSENNGNRAGTICLNDMSIIALAKTLSIPLVSMEKPVRSTTSSKRKIPDICSAETVEHIDFNTFLRREGITI